MSDRPSSVVSVGLWRTLSLSLPQIYTFVVSIVAARALGPANMGRQSFIAFVEGSLVLVLAAGLPLALIRAVGDAIGRGEPAAVPSLAATAGRRLLVLGATGAAVMVAIGVTRPHLRGAWLYAAIACFFSILHNLPSGVLAGLQRWKEVSLVGVVTGALVTVGVVVALATGLGVTGMFAAEAIVAAVNVAWTGRLALRAMRALPRPDGAVAVEPERRRTMLRYARLASLTVIIQLVVWRRSEFFFLDHYSAPSQIAMYSIAYATVTAVTRLPEALVEMLFPAVATIEGAGDRPRIRNGYSRLVRLLLVFILPVAAGLLAVGGRLLTLVYGRDYSGVGEVIGVAALFLPAIPIIGAAEALVTGLGSLRVAITAGLAGVVVDLVLSLVLIPRHGAVGAAIANGVAQTVSGVPLVLHGRHLLGGLDVSLSRTARVLLASVACGGAAALTGRAVGGAPGLAAAVAAGILVFVVAVVLLRAVAPDDARWLDDEAGSLLGGAVGRMCRRYAAVVGG